jgi:hypothetical protein
MTIKNLGDIAGLATALVGLIAASFTLLSSRKDRIILPTDSSSLRLIKIIRTPLGKSDWNTIRFNKLLWTFASVFVILLEFYFFISSPNYFLKPAIGILVSP